MKQTKSQIYKIRYQVYRDLGYSPKEARALRSKALDVSHIKIDKTTKKVEKKNNYKQVVKTIKVETYAESVKNIKRDTVYSLWGTITHDPRYKDDNAKMVKFIQKDLKINNKQAYYFLYFMLKSGLSYKETKKQMLSNKEFEMYRKR